MVADVAVVDIMTKPVVYVTVDTPVPDIARVMVERNISGVPVVLEGEVVGVVTEGDIVSREIEVDPPSYGTFLDAIFRFPWDNTDEELRRVLATTAGDLMSSPAITISTTATVRDAASLMYKHHVNPLPVIDEQQRLAGILSRSDIIRLLAAEAEKAEQ